MEETASLKKGEKQNSQVISLHEAYIFDRNVNACPKIVTLLTHKQT